MLDFFNDISSFLVYPLYWNLFVPIVCVIALWSIVRIIRTLIF